MKNKIYRYFIGILLIAAILIWIAAFQEKDENLKVVFCDIGQGDAAFIRFPNQDELLIDGGPDNSVLDCVGRNMPFYDRKIRSIMITHPDADHITGILEVLRRYEIEEVYLTGVNHKNLVYDKILSEIKKQNIKTINPRAGNVYKYGEVKLKILYPTENYQNQEVTNTNNTSIVAKLSSGSVDYLFTGDITESKSKEILAQNSSLLPSEILKVPHHGSKDFSKEFIEKVNPEISIISVGKKNRYGHPSKEILEILRKIRSKTYRTDEIGEAVIESNGKDFWKD